MTVFLNDLYVKKAELSAVSVNINDNSYWNSIIQSLPHQLAIFGFRGLGLLETCQIVSKFLKIMR